MRHYILKHSCPDATGIVAALTGLIADFGGLITEAAHFRDPIDARSLMRAEFEGDLPPPEEFERAFRPLAARLASRWSLFEGNQPCRVLIAVSREGHCLNSMLHRASIGALPIEVVGVVSNHPDQGRLAAWYELPFFHLPIEADGKAAQEARLLEVFEETNAELLVLARYMQILSDAACERLRRRCINIHHSFLPGFKGARPYHQAYARGVKIIGATAHYVTPDLDEGPIIEQGVERVDHTVVPESMIEIGHDLEAAVLNRAVRWHAEHRIFVLGQRTVVMRS
ncbi:MAG: formyltetrahydrofolate deformylase [Xanthomonadales bacterium]|nr:formyltetrahydrofolate deformylase [Xanthomonadales bacterium]